MSFEREELWAIRGKALDHSKTEGLNSQWKRCYETLADAADYLDAMIARTTWVEDTVVEGQFIPN